MTSPSDEPQVVTDFLRFLEDPDVAVAVAVIKALTGVIHRSGASTMMQMEGELQEAAAQLRAFQAADDAAPASRFHNSIATTAGCQLFLRVGTAEELAKVGIPTTVILDSAVAYYMEQVDIVIVGAEGVVENGGIVNSIGTYSTAVIAQAMKKQFYVAAESYKFARLYPLTQRDVPQKHMAAISGDLAGDSSTDETMKDVSFASPFFDYTPPGYIALMFTDLGVLTPSAVSDELIKLYQ
ncbi:unnamed protein product [Phytophthora fragariaefolia]|uniref:Unnamed protein product n=1 Tax=Phytophthora fragariaefolia TaxID=1490495 RepID=A0A9W7D3Q5_9STRA|nr:unnamed protein product [Phytophthora fragariaefolia]